MKWRYLTEQEILIMHALVVDATGGSHGVRDVVLLSSAAARPQTTVNGADAFPTVFERAAVYLDSIARHHVFIDGNKRTAIVVAGRFLYLSEYVFAASEKEIVSFVIAVATQKLDIAEIALWLKAHSKKTKTIIPSLIRAPAL